MFTSSNQYIFEQKCDHPICEWIGVMCVGISLTFIHSFASAVFIGLNIVEPMFLFGWVLIFIANPLLKNAFFEILKSISFWILMTILLFLAFIGVCTASMDYTTNEAIVAVYGDFRSMFLLVVCVLMARNRNVPIRSIDRIFFRICLVLAFADGSSLYLFKNFYESNDLFRSTMFPGIPYFVALRSIIARRPVLSIIGLVITLVITVLSALRLNYIFVGLGALTLALYGFLYLKELNLVSSILSMTVLIACCILVPAKIIRYYESDVNLTIHGINRIESTLQGDFDRSGDYPRVASNTVIFTDMPKFIVPRGLGGKLTVYDISRKFGRIGMLSSLDSGMFYCVYHFGLLFGFMFIIYIYYTIICKILEAISCRNIDAMTCSTMLILPFLAFFLLKALIFISISYAFFFAMASFWIYRPNDFAILYSVPECRKLNLFK